MSGHAVMLCHDPRCKQHESVALGGETAKFQRLSPKAKEQWVLPLDERAFGPAVETFLLAAGGVPNGPLAPDNGPYAPLIPLLSTPLQREVSTPDYNTPVNLDSKLPPERTPSAKGYTLFHQRPTFPTDVRFGLEVEAEYLPGVAGTLSAPAAISSLRLSVLLNEAGAVGWGVAGDGSLRVGYELRSPVYDSGDVILQHAASIQKVLRILRAHNFAATPRCGGHIHFSPTGGLWNQHSLRRMMWGWNTVGPIIQAMSRKHRLNSSHASQISFANAPFIDEYEGCVELDSSSSFDSSIGPAFGGCSWLHSRRTNALNVKHALTSHNTIEMRAPQGTLDTRRLLSHVLWGSWLVHWAQQTGTTSSLPLLETNTMTPEWLAAVAHALGAPERTAALMAQVVEHYAETCEVYNVTLGSSIYKSNISKAMEALSKLYTNGLVLALPDKTMRNNLTDCRMTTVDCLLNGMFEHESRSGTPHDIKTKLRMAIVMAATAPTTDPSVMLGQTRRFAEALLALDCRHRVNAYSSRADVNNFVSTLYKELLAHSPRIDYTGALVERLRAFYKDQIQRTLNLSATSLEIVLRNLERLHLQASQFITEASPQLALCFMHYKNLYDPQGFIPLLGNLTRMAPYAYASR